MLSGHLLLKEKGNGMRYNIFMTERKDRLAYLLQQYAVKKTGTEEEEELYVLIEGSDDETLKDALLPILENSESLAEFDETRWRPMMERIVSREGEAGSPSTIAQDESLVVSLKGRTHLWKRIAVAASIIGAIFFAGYWMMKDKPTDDGPQTTVIQTNDVQAPDKNRAQIKLSDGTVVYLDSAANGELAMQGNVKLVKNANGEIEYNRESAIVNGEIQYNTLFNPRGSRVQPLTLSDGTKVWLNSESSIKYPIAFNGSQRKVEITGEAYFEVTHDASKKFIVVSNGVNTEVLGTHFNINSYTDEGSLKVTLLEGSVKVVNPESSIVIKPGQQAQVTGGIKVSSNVDVEQVMAWKNGSFQFKQAGIESIMREIARWYDIEVVYEGDKPAGQYAGMISRNTNLSEVLKIFELNGVKTRIEGKRLVVLK